MTQRRHSHERRPIATVAGESAREIVTIAARMDLHPRDDGMMHFELEAPIEEIAPLVRAVMRVEAELLVADAATIGTQAEERRTPDQRRCDAFVALILRAGDALTQAA